MKDVLAFCRLRHNPRDELAWHRALRLFERVGQGRPPACGRRSARRPTRSPAAAALRPGGPAAAGPGALRRRAREVAGLSRPEEIVLSVARATGTATTSSATYPNWRDREGDLARLAEIAARAATWTPSWATSSSPSGSRPTRTCPGRRGVALSTIHQAKGLEWPVVFVLQVEPGSFPSGWAVSEGNLDEEERLFYVAVTRAADELYLCRPIAARRAWDTGGDAVVLNSGQGFLDRDLAGLVEEWSVR